MGNSNSTPKGTQAQPQARPRPRPQRQPAQEWIWRCNAHEMPWGLHECPAAFHTAPELWRHLREVHQLASADIAHNQEVLLVRTPLPEGENPAAPPTVRKFIRSEDFDPHWPIGPMGKQYGPWMVRRKGRQRPVSGDMEDPRNRREERNPRVWERFFVPDWYYDEISRRARMRKGRVWD